MDASLSEGKFLAADQGGSRLNAQYGPELLNPTSAVGWDEIFQIIIA